VSATSSPITTVPAAVLPPILAGLSGPDQVVAGGAAAFDVVASDSNVPALPLTYTWTASGGNLAPDASNPASATWQAPPTAGSWDLTVTVSNGVSSSTRTRTVTVVLAQYQASLAIAAGAPRRLGASQDGVGGLFVVDGRQGPVGRVALLTVRGETRGFASLPEPALAVAGGAGSLWVTTAAGSVYEVDPGTGRPLNQLALAAGPFQKPFGIAYDAVRKTLWVADKDAGAVRIIRPDGSSVATLTTAGSADLGAPVDVAIDSTGGKAWVLLAEPNGSGLFLHAFDLGGSYLGSYLPVGDAAGQLSRGGGVTAGPDGRVYVADAFQGVIQVLDRGGSSAGTVGAFGEQPGQLIAPAGLAVLGNGDLAVANVTLGRVDRFGSGAPLPSCTVSGQLDTDCDGLPDAWELAHGLDPRWAGDALLPYRNTGFTGYDVFAYESRYGVDPWTPVVAASAPAVIPPGLVKMLATVAAPGGYAIAWTQASGPATVSIRGANTGAPSFVARIPGVYAFDVVATTDLGASAPVRVSVKVENVPPVADAGRVMVQSPDAPLRLDGSFSSDANGDAPTLSWDQTLGPPVAGAQSGATLVARPRGAGLYRFQLTATDSLGASSTAEVPVLVTAESAPTAIAAALPAEAQVGEAVKLDAGASLVDEDDARFAWQQVEGPGTVTLAGAREAVASFVPAAAGRYVFEVTVGANTRRRSPPARVEVFVAQAGRALPSIGTAGTSERVVPVGLPVSLEASGSGTGYAWRQVSGPAAGLTGADGASATAVPFSPGFHVFEVAALDGAAVSRPVRVAFEARAGGKAIPQARATVVGGQAVSVGQLVLLDGRASTGAARFRWTQVAGPWTPLDLRGGMATFRAHSPGSYAFELEVDDGTVRSAPARVEVIAAGLEEEDR
jgi:hypothetical protein